MAMLGADDGLVHRPARVLVAGTSGAGKSTLARRIAARLDLPYFEIDALFHGPDWTPRPQFGDEVRAWADSAAWVTEWQYPAARERLADRADLLVWLDLPRRVVMGRVVRRTVVRSRSRLELWNGNREPPLRTILTDRDHVVRWAWRTHGESPGRVRECLATRPALTGVQLRSRAEVQRWVEGPLVDSGNFGRHSAV
jgi:adenylate kinase family enzyme